MNKIFLIKNLSYEIHNKIILKNINCEIEEGITIIKGPNGAGKTTFLKLMFGLINPTNGTIERKYNTNITSLSFVFQNPIFLDRTVEENLEHILYCKNIAKSEWKKIIKKYITKYSLEYMLNLNVKVLSGGELQLLSLLRSIIVEPQILFYDEPTNNLDDKNVDLVIQIIKELTEGGSSMIMVSHDKFSTDTIKYKQLSINQGVLE